MSARKRMSVKTRSDRFAVAKRSGRAQSILAKQRSQFRANVESGSASIAALRRLPRVEAKFHDAMSFWTNQLGQLAADSSTGVSISTQAFQKFTAGATSSGVQIPTDAGRGVAQNERLGRSTYLKRLRLKGNVSGQTTSSTQLVRMALIYVPRIDKGSTTLPAQTDIWVTQDPRQQRATNNAERFKILKSWEWILAGSSTAPSTGAEGYAFDEMIDLKNLPVLYTQASTGYTYDELEQGALLLYAHGTGAAGAATSTFINFTARVYFGDQ